MSATVQSGLLKMAVAGGKIQSIQIEMFIFFYSLNPKQVDNANKAQGTT